MRAMRLTIMLLGWLLLGATTPALAADKVALVVGINSYANIKPLMKARRDAQDMAALLRGFGFEVIEVADGDRQTMTLKLAEFRRQLQGASIGLFYYAGHAIELKGENLLLVRDFPNVAGRHRDEVESLLRADGFNLGGIAGDIAGAGAKAAVLILDACRENPLTEKGTRNLGAPRGLQRLADAPSGTYIVYAAGVGQSALDRLSDGDTNPNGLFMRFLLPELRMPGRTLDQAVKAARLRVREEARSKLGHDQFPAIYDQLLYGEVVLSPLPTAVTQTAMPVQVPPISNLSEKKTNKPGIFLWPVRGKIVASFGERPGGPRNDGINIAAERGTSVSAAGDGVIAYAGNQLKSFGNLVLIRHESGWVTVYAHLATIDVEQGQKVMAGAKLGTVGQTGNVNSPQLHFAVRKDQRVLDPEAYLPSPNPE